MWLIARAKKAAEELGDTITHVSTEANTLLQAVAENMAPPQDKKLAEFRASFGADVHDYEEFDKFRKEFNVHDKTAEIEQILRESPALHDLHAELVPVEVTFEDFWARYYYHELHKNITSPTSVGAGGPSSSEDVLFDTSLEPASAPSEETETSIFTPNAVSVFEGTLPREQAAEGSSMSSPDSSAPNFTDVKELHAEIDMWKTRATKVLQKMKEATAKHSAELHALKVKANEEMKSRIEAARKQAFIEGQEQGKEHVQEKILTELQLQLDVARQEGFKEGLIAGSQDAGALGQDVVTREAHTEAVEREHEAGFKEGQKIAQAEAEQMMQETIDQFQKQLKDIRQDIMRAFREVFQYPEGLEEAQSTDSVISALKEWRKQNIESERSTLRAEIAKELEIPSGEQHVTSRNEAASKEELLKLKQALEEEHSKALKEVAETQYAAGLAAAKEETSAQFSKIQLQLTEAQERTKSLGLEKEQALKGMRELLTEKHSVELQEATQKGWDEGYAKGRQDGSDQHDSAPQADPAALQAEFERGIAQGKQDGKAEEHKALSEVMKRQFEEERAALTAEIKQKKQDLEITQAREQEAGRVAAELAQRLEHSDRSHMETKIRSQTLEASISELQKHLKSAKQDGFAKGLAAGQDAIETTAREAYERGVSNTRASEVSALQKELIDVKEALSASQKALEAAQKATSQGGDDTGDNVSVGGGESGTDVAKLTEEVKLWKLRAVKLRKSQQENEAKTQALVESARAQAYEEAKAQLSQQGAASSQQVVEDLQKTVQDLQSSVQTAQEEAYRKGQEAASAHYAGLMEAVKQETDRKVSEAVSRTKVKLHEEQERTRLQREKDLQEEVASARQQGFAEGQKHALLQLQQKSTASSTEPADSVPVPQSSAEERKVSSTAGEAKARGAGGDEEDWGEWE